jgi:hypothetical protein
MNKSDENIQKQVEAGMPATGIDADAYQLVFKSLKKNPGFNLSPDFAQKVAALPKAPATAFNWDKIFLISGIVGFIGALIYVITYTQFTLSAGAFHFVSGYPALFAFGAAFIFLLNWLDKKLLRNTHSV